MLLSILSLARFRAIVRPWLKTPGLAMVAAVTVALGIGANTAVFSVAKAVLFRPLNFPQAERLVSIQMSHQQTGLSEELLSWRDREDIAGVTGSFESLAQFGSPGVTWEHEGRV